MKSPSLRSFSAFIKQGLSIQEIEVIDSIRNVIGEFLEKLAGNIAKQDGWRRYGNEKDGEFSFYPSLFTKRLKEQMKSLERRLQFQEMMSHSQLFIEFVDAKRKESILREEVGAILANWIYQKWRVKKQRK